MLLSEEMIRPGTALTVCCAVLVAVLSGCGAADTAGSDASVAAGSSANAADSTDTVRTAWLERGHCREVPPGTVASGTVASGIGSSVSSAPASDIQAIARLLTINGTHLPRPLVVDMATLDAMQQVECLVNDRQGEGRDVTFAGVLLSDVLASLGAGDATTLHALALNDYAVDIPMSDIDLFPVLLATRSDGEPMSVANYGPLRIVYPTTGYDLDPTVYDPRWIWQLSSIELQ